MSALGEGSVLGREGDEDDKEEGEGKGRTY